MLIQTAHPWTIRHSQPLLYNSSCVLYVSCLLCVSIHMDQSQTLHPGFIQLDF